MNQIKLIVLDVDGVMTDGKKYYTREGKVVMKQFCDKDWTAIKRFRALGVNVVFLTGDPFNESIPVAPAAHYWMGGISTNLNAETSLKNLKHFNV